LFPILIPRFLVPGTELYILIGMVQCRHRHLSRIQLLLAVVRVADQADLVAALARADLETGQSGAGQLGAGLSAVGLSGAGQLAVGLSVVGLTEMGAVIPVLVLLP
jgi:hypothetical protein